MYKNQYSGIDHFLQFYNMFPLVEARLNVNRISALFLTPACDFIKKANLKVEVVEFPSCVERWLKNPTRNHELRVRPLVLLSKLRIRQQERLQKRQKDQKKKKVEVVRNLLLKGRKSLSNSRMCHFLLFLEKS